MVKNAQKPARKPPLTIVKSDTQKPAAALTPPTNLDAETFHFHLGIIIQMNARKAAVAKLVKQARRSAVDAGLNLETLDRTIRNRELEPETVQQNILREWQYNHWAGLAPGVQPDLFSAADSKQEDESKWEHEGYVGGLEGETAHENPRYDTSGPAGQARLRGWNKGQAVIAERFKPTETQTVQ